MSKIKDITGQRFGRLTVIERVPNPVHKNRIEAHWRCICDCGNEVIATGSHLRTGHTTSCGCYRKDNSANMQKKYNKYDLSGEYGICYSSNTDDVILFDIEDYDKIKDYCWSVAVPKKCYNYKRVVAIKTHGVVIKMHRIIMGITNPDCKIDHKNRNPLDNRKSNLRICTTEQNNWNTPPKHDGYKGVSQDHNRWVAKIREDGKQITIGRFDTAEEAALAYNEKAKELFGEFAYLNNINTEGINNGN